MRTRKFRTWLNVAECVPGTSIEYSIAKWSWSRKDGLWFILKSGEARRSSFTLPEFLRGIRSGDIQAKEIAEPVKPEITTEHVEKLKRLVANMVHATSAYEEFARGWKEKGKVDPFKATRMKDFQEACELGKKLLQEFREVEK